MSAIDTADMSAGTLTLADDQISGDKVEGGTINAITINTLASTTVNATTVNATSLTGELTGNASSVTNGVYTTDTGSVTNTMLAGSIENAKLVNDDITIGTTTIELGSSNTTIAGLTNVYSALFTGPLTGNVTGNLTGNADTVTNGVYTTDTGTVTNTMLAGSIENAKLVNNDITLGTTTLALGGNSSVIAGLTNVTSALFTGDVTGNVTGNLTGNADTVTNGVYTSDTGSVTNTMLAGSIENAKLVNNDTTIGSTTIALGGNSNTLAGLASVTATTFIGNLSGILNGNVNDSVAGTLLDNTAKLFYGNTSVSTGTSTFNNVTTNGALIANGTSTFNGDLEVTAGNTATFEDVTISGALSFNDLTVPGAFVAQGSAEFDTNFVKINAQGTAQNAGIIIERGVTDARLYWDETADKWTVEGGNLVASAVEGNLIGEVKSSNGTTVLDNGTNGTDAEFTGSVIGTITNSGTNSMGTLNVTNVVATSLSGALTGTVSTLNNHTTDDLAEGTSNEYYTDGKTDARIALQTGANLDITQVDTDALPEGSSSLYFTNTRADARVAAATGANLSLAFVDTDDLGEGTSNRYFTDGRADARIALQTGANLNLANKTTDDLTQGSTNLYFSDALADARVNLQTGANLDLSLKSTTHLSEGSNQYFTDARAQNAITVVDAGGDGSVTYSGGTLTYTGPSAAEVQAHITGGTGVTVASGAVSIGQDVSTTANVTFNSIGVTGGFNPATISVTGAATVGGKLTVNGDLEVTGSTTTLNTQTIELADNTIQLNSDFVDGGSGPTANAGIEVNRGGGSYGDVSLLWDESADNWTIGGEDFVANTFIGDVTGDVTGNITSTGTSTFTVVDINSGSVDNTVIGANQATSATFTSVNASTITASTITATTNFTGNVIGQVSSISNFDTDDLTEGTNLYYTPQRVNTLLNGAVTNSIIPSDDDVYDLGSSTKRWRDLYLGPQSLNMEGRNILSMDVANSKFNFKGASGDDVNVEATGTGDVSLTAANYITLEGETQLPTSHSLSTKVVDAVDIVVGQSYKIKTVGTTDWNTVAGTSEVSYGAGDELTAVVAGSGSGTAYEGSLQIAVPVVLPSGTVITGLISDLSNHDLDAIGNVNLTVAPTDGQSIIWDDASNQWIAGESFNQADFDTAFSLKSVGELVDVDTGTPVTYEVAVINNGTGDYDVTSGTDRNGTVTGSDPTITIEVGDTIAITNNSTSAHPLYIKTAGTTGTGDLVTGATGQQAYDGGTVTWTATSAGTYYYQCSNHLAMQGIITVNASSSGAASDGQALIWDATTGNWIPGESFSQADFDAAIALTSVGALVDVDMATAAPTDGQVLKWDAANSEFIPGDNFDQDRFDTAIGEVNIDELFDVDTTGVADNHILQYNATNAKWETTEFTAVQNLGDIGDVDLSTAPAAGQALVYNGADWVAANATGTVGAFEIDVTVNGSGEWVIDGTTYKRLSLVRGLTYYFNVNAVGNNFYLKTALSAGTTDAVTVGITNNGTDNGTITYEVPMNAPNTLYYVDSSDVNNSGVVDLFDLGAPTDHVRTEDWGLIDGDVETSYEDYGALF